MPSRLTGQNIGLYLRGHCKKYFFQIFFHSHDWHMWVTMFKKVCVIWRWWEKSHFFEKLAYVRPNGPSGMRSFFRPPPNDLNFGTHYLLHKQRWIPKVFYFSEFFVNLKCPLD